jgi:hypothetical protein
VETPTAKPEALDLSADEDAYAHRHSLFVEALLRENALPAEPDWRSRSR